LSSESAGKMDSAAELIRKGGTLLKEACSRCGGLQVRYKGRIVCINCGDISATSQVEVVDAVDVVAGLRDLVTRKIRDTTSMLKNESDPDRQSDLVTLLLKYLELLERATKVSERGS